jgi:hypothetical protein
MATAYNERVYGGNEGDERDARLGDALTLGLGGFEASADRKGAVNTLLGVPDLELNNTAYQGPQYAGDFTPEMYSDPMAASYQLVNEDPRTREMQMQALRRLQQYGDQAADSTEALGRYQATSDASALAAQREAAIRNQMQMRGQGGSAAEFSLQQGAAQGAADRAQGGGLTAAMQAALQRLQGTNAAMAGAGALRDQDFGVAAHNGGIVNAFNMRNTDALNAARNANTGLRNASGLRNLDARQNWMNGVTNTGNVNIDRDNNNRRTMYDAKMGKATATGNALMGKANSGAADANSARDDAWGMAKDAAMGFAGAFGKKDEKK